MPPRPRLRQGGARVGLAVLLAVGLTSACGGGGGAGTGGLDTGEASLGGTTTVFNTSLNAFGFPLANLVEESRGATFLLGNSFFRTDFVPAPSTTPGRDGLGPLFNGTGCAACHFNDGRAAPPADPDGVEPGLLFKLARGLDVDGAPLADPTYGTQLQADAIAGVAPEGRVRVEYQEEVGAYGDGTPFSLRRPTYTPMDLAHGPLAAETRLSPRVAPSVFGLGLLAALSEGTLLARADPLDLDQDGVSGRAQRVAAPQGAGLALGRFGWKASQPTLETQSAVAFLHDVGVTSPLLPTHACTQPEQDCLAAPSGGEPEVDAALLDPLNFYMHTLAVPGRRAVNDPEVRRGSELFTAIGCARCHVPELTTGHMPGFPELSFQRIRPFTDLLLHDMGPGLADDVADHEAAGSEWRTPPLWGLGLQSTVSGHTFLLHDGRARDAAEAILWHGGEGAASRERFRLLPAADREALLAFLRDL